MQMLKMVAGKRMAHNKIGTTALCKRLVTNKQRSLQAIARTVG